MIYLQLFVEFFKIGLFSFGGAYSSIPLIQDVVMQNGWMSEEMFSTMIAISESTPGPIMVNAATYVGNMQAGFLGAVIATVGVVLPAFWIVILIVCLFQKHMKNPIVQRVLDGIKPCLMGVIIATGLDMLVSTIIKYKEKVSVDHTSILILLVLAGSSVVWKRIKKKVISPIVLILISAVLGILVY